MATVRYIVDDVETAVEFYRNGLGFTVRKTYGPVVILTRGDLELWVSGPGSSAAEHSVQANRFVVTVPDLNAALSELGAQPEIVDGAVGRWAVIEDPAGNPIELFETR
jgi:catechol 2,3-dioxygenase-like lactoylglutathione lyase family enzyme